MGCFSSKEKRKEKYNLPSSYKSRGGRRNRGRSKKKLKQFANCDEAFLQGLVKGTKLCLNPYFFG